MTYEQQEKAYRKEMLETLGDYFFRVCMEIKGRTDGTAHGIRSELAKELQLRESEIAEIATPIQDRYGFTDLKTQKLLNEGHTLALILRASEDAQRGRRRTNEEVIKELGPKIAQNMKRSKFKKRPYRG